MAGDNGKPIDEFLAVTTLYRTLAAVAEDEAEDPSIRSRATEVKAKVVSDKAEKMNDYWRSKIHARRAR